MSSTVKHWFDIAAGVATVLSHVATPIVTFVTSVLGAIWYGIRLYEWWKGKNNANVRND